MNRLYLQRIIALCLVSAFACVSLPASAEGVTLNANDLVPRVELFFSPQTGSFQEGSTFEVPVYINTKGNRINTVELHVRFDPRKLRIVKPSSGTSIIGLWVDAPSYDNERGVLDIAGAIPGGITTDSGLIVTVSFQALTPGEARVSIENSTQILLHDGVGTPVAFDTSRGNYVILAKAPEGPQIFSDSHPFPDRWYNNPNPIFAWSESGGSAGFSYVFDTTPTTMPANTINATGTTIAFRDVQDGVWYFHIKEQRRGVWGSPTAFAAHIDTAPPAEFTPTVGYVGAAVISRYLVSFFTTDNLSGIDHYEVGVIDKTQPTTVSPVFVPAESPYQIPFDESSEKQIIVRAFDKAGNVREASISVKAPFFLFKYLMDNAVVVMGSALILMLLLLLFHYLFGHHIVRRIEYIRALLKRDKEAQERAEKNPVPPSPPPHE